MSNDKTKAYFLTVLCPALKILITNKLSRTVFLLLTKILKLRSFHKTGTYTSCQVKLKNNTY